MSAIDIRPVDRPQGNLATFARDADPTDGDCRMVAEGIGCAGANREGGEVLFDEV